MKLKTAAKIETCIRTAIFTLFVPFEAVKQIVKYTSMALIWPIDKLLDWLIHTCWKIGNKLLRNSEEVKSGQICNEAWIRTETSRRGHIIWKNKNK